MTLIRFAMSALPSPKALVNAGVRVVCGLAASQLLLHAAHTGAKGVSSRPTLGLRTLQVTARSAVVRLPPKFAQATRWVLVLCLELESLLSHDLPSGLETHKAFV